MSLQPSPQSQSQSSYATAVLITLEQPDRTVTEAFGSARTVTEHDSTTVEVVHDVIAPSKGAAARRGVNLVAAILDAAGLQDQFSIEHTLTTPLAVTETTEPVAPRHPVNPRCDECGNTETFVHCIRASETCLYDEVGNYDCSKSQQVETLEFWCAKCESHDVECE